LLGREWRGRSNLQQAGPIIPSPLNVGEKVAISSLRILSSLCFSKRRRKEEFI
jgi:hypothetical protein